jgi:hypothetical protein
MAWIINDMPSTQRSEKMSIRLTHEEAQLRDELSKHLGVDHAGVMRMALLKLARAEGVSVPDPREATKHKTRRD